MPLSVVISTYNDGPRLPRTIAPLLADPATDELIIVVDGSDDGSFEALQARARKDSRVRPFFIENRGRPAACQFGIEQARSDVVLLIDADVVAASDSFVTGHARWHADGVPRLVVGYMPLTLSKRRRGSFVREHYSRMYELRSAEFERNSSVILTGLWAGNMSLPRSALEAAGGFDGGLGLRYNDDLELGLRLAETGIQPVFDRSLLAEHDFERSVRGYLSTARKYGEDLARIEARHPGQVVMPPPPRSRLDAAMRGLVVRPLAHRAVLGGGTLLVEWAGVLGVYKVEGRIGHKLERLQIEAGMRDARNPAVSAGTPKREGRGDGGLESLTAGRAQLRAIRAARARASRRSP